MSARHDRRGHAARVPKALYAWIAAAFAAATIAGVSMNWDQLFPVPADRLVTVYRAHHCPCFRAWIEHLEGEQFVVRAREVDNLVPVRARLVDSVRDPGCHVAVLDGYFVEGHVTAGDLRRLVSERPPGVGISVEGNPRGLPGLAPVARVGAYNVLVHRKDGSSEVWLSHAGT